MIFDALLHPCQRKKEEKELKNKCQNETATTTKCKQAEQHTNTLDIYVCNASVCVCVCRRRRAAASDPGRRFNAIKNAVCSRLSLCVCVCERMLTHVCVCESVAVSSSRARLSVPFVALLLNSASSSSLCVGKFRPWELHVKFRW